MKVDAIRTRFLVVVLLALGVFTYSQNASAQQTWRAMVGAETPDMGRQALAFLPNEIWIHAGDSITWTFNSDEIHTVSFLVVGQVFPPFPVGCPGFNVGSASFDGSTCVTTPPSVKPQTFTVTFPTAGNYKIQCLVHNTMNGQIHVLDPSLALPHNQAYYDAEAQRETRNLLTDGDHATSADASSEASSAGSMHMSHGKDAVSMRVIAANQRLSGPSRKLAASSSSSHPIAHVSAGIGEIASTPGGLQTNSLVRFVKGKITIHVGDTVEWSNFDPEEPHTITFGPEPQDMFDPSPGVTMDPDGGLSAVLNSPNDSLHSGFIIQALDDQPGTPVNSNPNNAIALNPTHFRVKFAQAGTYNYKCVLHDDLGMVGQVVVVP